MRPDGLIVHVSASEDKLMALAETVGLRKRDEEGIMRKIKARERDDFPPTGRGK